MRLFFAIDLPGPLRAQLLEAASILHRLSRRSMRLIPDENLHLTLKFIEDLPEAEVDELCQRVHARLADWRPFEVAVQGYGAFPHAGKARVFWAGVDDPEKKLQQLSVLLEGVAESVGVPRDKRRFAAHITLARLRQPAPLPLSRLMEALPDSGSQPLMVNGFTLYQSRTDPTGAVYTALADFLF